MANRRDYFFRQKVTEAELDVGFNGLEVADFNLAIDHGLVGITDDMVVSEKSGTPDLTVDVSGPGTAYSKQGERIFFSSLQNVDLSVDDGSVSTAVAAPGDAKIVSLFITFDRLLADPRIDGNSLTVFFERNESFAFSVVAGADATSGSEVPPALDTNKILLADVTLIFGQTQIFNADIDVATPSRREVAFAFAGSTPVALSEGIAEAAIGALLTALNNHITAAANKHPAADVTYAGSGNWANGSPLSGPPTDVETAIDQVVADLADITGSGDSGGDRIGMEALTATWADSSGFLAQSVRDAINKIVLDLGIGAGASRIGNAPAGNIAAADVQAALNELDGEKAGLALANIFTAAINRFDEGITQGLGAVSTSDADASQTRSIVHGADLSAGQERTELFHFVNTGVAGRDLRIYMNLDGAVSGGGSHLEITMNCSWDPVTLLWNRDSNLRAASMVQIGGGTPITVLTADATADATWTDTVGGAAEWRETSFRIDTSITGLGARARLEDGLFQFPNASEAASLVSNPTGAPLVNALYAKNTVDAWGKMFSQTTIDEDFGIVSAAAAGLGVLVTFDHSVAGAAVDQGIWATGDGTTATSASFLTADTHAVNAITIRSWRWDTANIVEETPGDWSILRMAKINV